MSEKIKVQVCLDCVKRNAIGHRQVPCLELHRRANAVKGVAVYGVPSQEVGRAEGHCPWIATWTEVLDIFRAAEKGKSVYANDIAQTTLRRIKQKFSNYEEKNSRSKWRYLSSEYWSSEAGYKMKNGRPEHMGNCLLYTDSGTSHKWKLFLEVFSQHVSVPDLYVWVGVGMKSGGVIPGWPEGREYISGTIWNKETLVGKSIQLSSKRFAFGAQANAGTPVLILIGGTKAPGDLVGVPFKGGFDIAFASGVGWTTLLKSLFKREAWAGAKALIGAFKKFGPGLKPSKADLNIAGIKSALATSGYGRRKMSLVVLDFPAGAAAELTMTLESTITVDEIK